MNNIIEDALKFAEAKGFAVSVHPTRTSIVKNFREYMTLAPMLEGSVAWSVREPMLSTRRDGFAESVSELHEVIGDLR